VEQTKDIPKIFNCLLQIRSSGINELIHLKQTFVTTACTRRQRGIWFGWSPSYRRHKLCRCHYPVNLEGDGRYSPGGSCCCCSMMNCRYDKARYQRPHRTRSIGSRATEAHVTVDLRRTKCEWVPFVVHWFLRHISIHNPYFTRTPNCDLTALLSIPDDPS